jgi:serine/threonine-protein kinase
LKIESEPFRGGSKGRDAQLVRAERYRPGDEGYVVSDLYELPNLVGRNRDEVLRDLAGARFVLGRIVEIASNQPGGTVLDQNPKPGERVPKGTPIDLVIARSSATLPTSQLKVPGLKGDDPKKALQELRQKGFDPRQEDVAECNATGRVLYSTPAKDALVESGSVVTIYVSSPGPDAVPIPKVTGLLRSQAEDELRRANLRARIAGTEPTNSRAPDTVMRQRPDERKLSKPGCEIALTLAIPMPKVQVPNFVNQSREQALGQLPRISFGGGLVRGAITEVENCDYAG